jgi:hypothetical protein
MMIKAVSLLVCTMLFTFTSCSNDDDKKEEVPTENYKFELSADTKEANIFDNVNFKLATDAINSGFMNAYDSIVWKVKNLGSSVLIYDKKQNGSHLYFSWSQCFFMPGEYENYLYGYKNGKMICGDTLTIKVKNDKDFLCRNWSDTDNLSVSIGYTDMLNNSDWHTNAKIKDGVPSLKLFINNKDNIDGNAFMEQSKASLYDYMTSLYGKPSCENDSQKLANHYLTFGNREENTVPIAFWKTPKTKIILLKRAAGETATAACYVYAEPIK